jgi:putative flippase GtrA
VAIARPQRSLARRSWRYTVIGLVCAVANYAVMLANDYLGGHYLLGTVISFLIVTPMAYVLHSLFTFAEPFSRKAFMRFVAGVASAYPVAAGLMIILCSGLRLSVAIATPIATVLIFGWNFAAAHWSILPRMGPAKEHL